MLKDVITYAGPLTGKRFRSKVDDAEEDDDLGEVTHPSGSEFTVGVMLLIVIVAFWATMYSALKFFAGDWLR